METASINHMFWKRKVSRSGESNLRPSAYLPSALPPGQAGSSGIERAVLQSRCWPVIGAIGDARTAITCSLGRSRVLVNMWALSELLRKVSELSFLLDDIADGEGSRAKQVLAGH